LNTPQAITSPAWREGDVILELYGVRGVVGGGSYGAVYKVYHHNWRMELAVKAPRYEILMNCQHLSHYLKCAESWADMCLHPNVVTCFYVREIDGIPCIFMEYVAGGSLREELARGLDLKGAIDYAIQICMGMDHAHKYSVIHGDLRPENCLINPDGILKVADFGMGGARAFGRVSVDGVGMPEYKAPEQWVTGATPKADIFSFGVILYEMVVGNKPFRREEGESLEDFHSRLVVTGWAYEEPAEGMPAAIGSLIKECLSERPEERPESFAQLQGGLEKAYHEVAGGSYLRRSVDEALLKVADLNKRGISLYDVGMKEEALSTLEDAVRADPSHMDSSYNHTLLLWERGKKTDSEVIRWLEMKAESRPDEWRPLYYLGLAHIARRDVASAEIAFQEALRVASVDGRVKTVLEEIEKAKDSWPRFLLTLKGHERSVKSIAVSTDGGFALSGSEDKSLRYWDLLTGECLRTLEGHERAVNSVAISTDGRFALSGSDDRSLRYWDLYKGECLTVLKGHERAVSSVAISPDGRFAVSGSDDRNLRCWDLTTGECLRTLEGHDDRVSTVAIPSGGRFAISQGGDRTIRLWDLMTGACLRTIDRHDRAAGPAVISTDGRFLISGSDDKNVCLWYLGGVESLRLPLVMEQLEKVEAEVDNDSEFSALKRRVAECMSNRNWKSAAEYLQRVRSFPGYERHPELMDLWQGIGMKGVRKAFNACWLKGILKGHEDWVNTAAFSPDGKIALSGSDDHTLRLWDLETGENIRVFRGHEDRVSSVAISPGGRFAISGGHDRTLRLWGLETGENLGILKGHRDWVSSVAVSPDGRFALSGSDDMSLFLWDLRMGERLRILDGFKYEVRTVAFSPDGRFALSAGDDCVLCLWDLRTRVCLHRLEGHESWVSSVAFSPDGRFALSGSLDDTLRLWDMRTVTCLRVLVGHEDWVRSVAISPDGRFGLSGGHDKTLRLWDLRTGECLSVIRGHEDWVSFVGFSPDGRFALSGSHDKTMRIWEFDWGYDFPLEVDWGEGALPYLEIFLTLHTPCATDNTARRGKTVWTDEDFTLLLHELSLRGYGWLKPEGVRRKLDTLAAARSDTGPGKVEGTYLSESNPEMESDSAVMHCICCGRHFPTAVLSAADFCPDCKRDLSRTPEKYEHGSWWKKLTGR
jgi:WD40 repeat protein/serine/threonine protein kinase